MARALREMSAVGPKGASAQGTVMATNLFGNALRDAFDPRLRRI